MNPLMTIGKGLGALSRAGRTSYGTKAPVQKATPSQSGMRAGKSSRASYNRGDYVTENGANGSALLKETFITADKEL